MAKESANLPWRLRRFGGLACILSVGFGVSAWGQSGYRVQSFRVPQAVPPAYEATEPIQGINNGGDMVGRYVVGDPTPPNIPIPIGYLVRQQDLVGANTENLTATTNILNIGTIGLEDILLSGVNKSGVIIGTFAIFRSFDSHGFAIRPPYDPDSNNLTVIDFPGHSNNSAFGINDAGDIVGSYDNFQHGFLLHQGVFTTIDVPNAIITIPLGINNVGQIVGQYQTGGPQDSHGFLLSNGVYTTIDFPGAPDGSHSTAVGINNYGFIIGGHTSNKDCFFWHNGVIAQINLGLPNATCNAINDFGQIAGGWGQFSEDPQGGHAYIATPATLYDPVPDLMNGPKVIGQDDITTGTDTGKETLATLGRRVAGVSSDGVTQAVVRIPATNEGDQFVVTVLKEDQTTQSSSVGDDGALSLTTSGSDSSAVSQVVATAVTTKAGVFAFAVYHAPVDFVRSSQEQDPAASSRRVFIQVQTPDRSTTLVPVTIVRPPVVFVHGLWGSQSTWNNFFNSSPEFLQRFHVGFANYSDWIGYQIFATDPPYTNLFGPLGDISHINGLDVLPDPSAFTRSSAMGFEYNAPKVLSEIRIEIQKLRGGENPSGLPVAAVQADIVAHSMGGNIVRTIPHETSFLGNLTYGQGNIHKLITIDTPHLGSPLAVELLKNENSCVRGLLAAVGQTSLKSVTFRFGFGTQNGAVGDLEGDEPAFPESDAIAITQVPLSPVPHPLPTAMIAGTVSQANLAGLDPIISVAGAIRCICGSSLLCHPVFPLISRPSPNPLADKFTSADWNSVFNGNLNDAIVSLGSQLNGDLTAGFQFEGVHSGALTRLGFGGPSVLDPGVIPAKVLELLNAPVSDPAFKPLPQ